MKTLAELGIRNESNLIVDFPGSIQADVDETVRNILDFAITYQPLSPTRFHLGLGSTVATQPEGFSVSAIRNADFYRNALPEDVWRRIHLLDLSFDCSAVADWSPVEALCRVDRGLMRTGSASTSGVRDGGTFLRLTDRRRRATDRETRSAEDSPLPDAGFPYRSAPGSSQGLPREFSGGDFDARPVSFVGAM